MLVSSLPFIKLVLLFSVTRALIIYFDIQLAPADLKVG